MECRIGQFSLITRFPIKTLRYYHEIGLLVPARTDEINGYRYYDENQVETARAISLLRGLEFPLGEIARMLDRLENGTGIEELIEEHGQRIDEKIVHLERVRAELPGLHRKVGANLIGAPREGAVEVRELAGELVASVRFRGTYREIGDRFRSLATVVGPHGVAVPFALYWQEEYAPEQADIELCIPVTRVLDDRRSTSRVVPAARCIVTVHRGPYDSIGESYSRAIRSMETAGQLLELPIRERYLRGPESGVDPRDFLTEIALPIGSSP